MSERRPARQWIRLFWGMVIVDGIALALALALPSLPLMLLALAIPALAGIGLFSVIMRDRRPGSSRSWPPPGTRI